LAAATDFLSNAAGSTLVRGVKWLLVVWVIGCGGTDHLSEIDAAGGAVSAVRVPTITEIRPTEAPLFGAAFVLEVSGDVDPDAVILLDGVPLVTRVISATELEADVGEVALQSPGIRPISVLHTGEDGGSSNERPLRIVDGIAQPLVDALVPDRAVVGAADFEIEVRGWNFYPTSVVHVAGTPRSTSYVDANRLRVTLTMADVAVAGDVTVTVMTEAIAAPSLAFVVENLAAATTARLSVTPTDGQSGGIATDVTVSADGRHVAFASTGNDLVAGDAAGRDIFWRDTCRGASGCTPATRRVSERLGGGDSNGVTLDPVISANGRFVAFMSTATDLDAGPDAALEDLFVHDTCLGATSCTPSTTRVERPPIPVAFVGTPSISEDGRFVAYGAGSTSVWLADTCLGATGCTPSVARVDAEADGTPGTRAASSPAISGNGRYVAFRTNSPNLGAPQAAFITHAYVLDTCFGASGCTRSIARVDVTPDATEADGQVPEGALAITPDGRYVTFASIATNLGAGATGGRFQVYRRDTCAGAVACTPATVMISVTSGGGGGDDDSMASTVTPDGRFIAFRSEASDLAAGDTNGRNDVFARDTCLGVASCTPVTRKITIGHDGTAADDHSPATEFAPRISADGAVTVWTSRATNLIPDDTNGQPDAFVSSGGAP
jgi:Tol biopolymer transport system component